MFVIYYMDSFCKNKFRKLKKDDYKDFYFLINQLRHSNLSKEKFEETLMTIEATKIMEVWVVEKYDTSNSTSSVIGTGTIIYEPKFIRSCGKVAHIEDVVISASHRCSGLGKEFIQFLINNAHENYCYKVILNCDKNISEFYKKCGFTEKNIQMAKYFNE